MMPYSENLNGILKFCRWHEGAPSWREGLMLGGKADVVICDYLSYCVGPKSGAFSLKDPSLFYEKYRHRTIRK